MKYHCTSRPPPETWRCRFVADLPAAVEYYEWQSSYPSSHKVKGLEASLLNQLGRRTDDVSDFPRQHKRIFDYFLSSGTKRPRPLLWEAETAAATKLCYTVSNEVYQFQAAFLPNPSVLRVYRVFRMEYCRPDHTSCFPRNMPSYSSGVWRRFILRLSWGDFYSRLSFPGQD